MYYVYAYIRPDNFKTFYIGKGKGTRKDFHLKEILLERETDNAWKDRVIKKFLSNGQEVIIKIIKNFLIEEEAYFFEKKLIAKRFGNGILTNMCPDNKPPCHKGKKFVDRKSPSTKGKPGRQWTEEDKIRHSELMKNLMASSEIREKVSDAKLGHVPWNKGRQMTEQEKANLKEAFSSPESRRKRSQAKEGKANPCFGKICVNNGVTNMMIPKDTEIPIGWIKGRLKSGYSS